jgi:hypothetical protein
MAVRAVGAARPGRALVHVILAEVAGPPREAAACKRVDKVRADPVVRARVAAALIDIRHTVLPTPARPAVAVVAVGAVLTAGAVAAARSGGALVYVVFASATRPPGEAAALERVDAVRAGAIVGAWVTAALVDIRHTVLPAPPRSAVAVVAVGAVGAPR